MHLPAVVAVKAGALYCSTVIVFDTAVDTLPRASVAVTLNTTLPYPVISV